MNFREQFNFSNYDLLNIFPLKMRFDIAVEMYGILKYTTIVLTFDSYFHKN